MTLLDAHAALALRAFGRALRDVLEPQRCALCPSADAGDGLGCAQHRLELGLAGPRCEKCAAALPAFLPDEEICASCRLNAPGFTRAACLLDYASSDAVRAWVLALKHGGRRDLARPLGEALGARLVLEPAHDASSILVPVPLHRLRVLERGYDQARLLARWAANGSGLRWTSALRRTRFTTPQGAPGSVSRSANVRAAFAPARPRAFVQRAIDGRAVWLVDDVLTSGATAAECARALRKMGARDVCVLALARA